MAQRIGASGRQTVLAVFVGSGMAFAVGMGFQTTSKAGEGVRTVMPIGAATIPAQAANQAYFSIIAIMALNASSSEKYVLINSKISSPLLPLL